MHLWLVGMMGSGKTTTAQHLGKELGWDWVDTDLEVEKRKGRTIPQLFAEEGENFFRANEVLVIGDLVRRKSPAVIATGGGAVLSDPNLGAMQSSGTVIYLHTPPHICWQRLATTDLDLRPLLGETSDPQETLSQIYRERHPLYRLAAGLVVETDKLTPNQVTEQILELCLPPK